MKKTIITAFICFWCLIPISSFAQDITKTVSVTSLGKTLTGGYSIWYNSSHSNKIIKPFIICEGIDIMNQMSAIDVKGQVGYNYTEYLREARGFDIIVLNLNNNHMAIEQNADLFIELIKTINQELVTNQSNYRLNVLGVSMGGLIIRYALAKMEKDGLDHRVENYISYDSPHLGANVPLGMQQMVDNYFGTLIKVGEWNTLMSKINSTDIDDIFRKMAKKVFGESLLDAADYTAAIEMSACYMHDNIWRQAYLNNLNSVGAYPKKCRNIAVAMGASGVSDYGTGVELFRYKNKYTLIDQKINLPFGLGYFGFVWIPLDLNLQANAMPENGVNAVTFNGRFQIQPLINGPVYGPNDTKYSNAHSSIAIPSDLRLDNAPGSFIELPLSEFRDWLNTKVTIHINLSKKVCIRIPWVGNVCETVGKNFDFSFKRSDIFGTLSDQSHDRFCFVPTLSALAINNTNWFDKVNDIVPTYPYCSDKSITPFDAMQYSNANYDHALQPDEDKSTVNFLRREVTPDHLYLQNKSFDGTYTNVFETRDITVGNNVDPVPYRSAVGNVTVSGSNITLRVPKSGKIVVANGSSLKGNVCLKADRNYICGPSFPFEPTPPVIKSPPAPVTNEPPTESNKTETREVSITDDDGETSTMKAGVAYTKVDYKIPETKIDVFPNPIVDEGNLYMEISKSTRIKAEIVSIQGIVIKTLLDRDYEPGFQSFKFNAKDLATGIYLCRVYYDNTYKTIKLIK